MIYLSYVDNALFVYRSKDAVEDLTSRMEELGLLFEEESDFAGYLGVHIQREPDAITLTQKGLAQRIVELCT